MTERTCENCRWWKGRVTGYGYCHKRPPIVSGGDESFPSTHKSNFCGEWSDASITPEQEERQELIRRFAVALISAGMPIDDTTWNEAAKFAAAEPQIQREVQQ